MKEETKQIVLQNDLANVELGLRHKKHIKKVDRESLVDEYERLSVRRHQIERKAGFYDQKHNIFQVTTVEAVEKKIKA